MPPFAGLDDLEPQAAAPVRDAATVPSPRSARPRPSVPAAPAPTCPVPIPATDDRIRTGTRALLVVFVAFTLLAVNQLLMLGGDTDTFFAWPIHSRPNSAYLGAAYGAGVILSVLALVQRRWSRVRIGVVTVGAFTVLTLIPTLLHRHRLSFMADAAPTARLAAYVWLAVYVLVPIACAVVVVRQGGLRREREVRQPMPVWLAVVLLAQGTVLATIGATLYLSSARSHMSMEMAHPGWPWPVTPLTGMVIGAWLMSFGFAAVLAVRERDLSRMLAPSVAYAANGGFQLVVLLTNRTAPGTDVSSWWVAAVLLTSTLLTGGYGAFRAAAGPKAVPAPTV